MIKQKEKLEEEIRALQEVLNTQNVGQELAIDDLFLIMFDHHITSAGMEEPLVDGEGFPRSDIDVYQVRHARHSIRCKVTRDIIPAL